MARSAAVNRVLRAPLSGSDALHFRNMSLPVPKLSRLRRIDTLRLIPSRFAEREDSVLTAISENLDHLRDLFELDNATNERLIGERGGLPGIGVDELVFGVPNFRIVNAAFTYPRRIVSADLDRQHATAGRADLDKSTSVRPDCRNWAAACSKRIG